MHRNRFGCALAHCAKRERQDDKMERVCLEIFAAAAMQASQVVQLVQDLDGVPKDALCEIQGVRCLTRRLRQQRGVCSVVQLNCESCVADFLCHKFGCVRVRTVLPRRCCTDTRSLSAVSAMILVQLAAPPRSVGRDRAHSLPASVQRFVILLLRVNGNENLTAVCCM